MGYIFKWFFFQPVIRLFSVEFGKLFKKLGHSPTRHLFRKIIGISTTALSCFSTHLEEFPLLETTVVLLEVLPANLHICIIKYYIYMFHIHYHVYNMHISSMLCSSPDPLGSNFKVLRLLTAHLFAETPSPPSTMSSLWRFMSP